jgi:hypothetical protein
VSRDGQTVQVQTPAGRMVGAIGRKRARQRDGEHPSRADADRAQRPDAKAGRNRIVGRPIETTFLGEASEHVLLVGEQRITVIAAPPLFEVPAEMAVEFDPQDVVVLAE